jgi:hypothetical protein
MKASMPLDARSVIGRLLAGQRLGVLATREPRAPYQSLVAFAASADLRHLYFATAKDTRKYANLVRFPQVSLLVDNRRNAAADFVRGVAVTALGWVAAIGPRSRKKVLDLYLGKHPALEGFARSPSCRMFRIRVETYILVSRFQQVQRIEP